MTPGEVWEDELKYKIKQLVIEYEDKNGLIVCDISFKQRYNDKGEIYTKELSVGLHGR